MIAPVRVPGVLSSISLKNAAGTTDDIKNAGVTTGARDTVTNGFSFLFRFFTPQAYSFDSFVI